MAVTTTKTNKPINPRGNDQSPKGYNRAALYSGKALDFDGVNDSIDLDGFTLSGTTATFVFNLKADSPSFTSKYVFDTTQRWRVGQTDTANKFGFHDAVTWRNSIQELTAGEWYNIAIVVNGTDVEFLWNGESIGDTFSGVNPLSWASLTDFKLGSNLVPSGGYLDGQIAGFKIFNTALTAAQVSDLYNNPEKIVPTGVSNDALKLWLPMMEGAGTTAYDGSGNGNHGTISGATWTHGIGSPVAQTAVIDWNKYSITDTTDYANVSSTTIASEGTIVFKHVPLASVNGSYFIAYGSNQLGRTRSIRQNSGKYGFVGYGSGSQDFTSTQNVEVGKITNVAYSWNSSGDVKIYVDGVKVGDATKTLNPIVASNAYINSNLAGGQIHNQIMFYAGLYDEVLTESQIQDIHDGTTNPESVSGLVHFWRNSNDWQDEVGSADLTENDNAGKVLFPQTLTTGRDLAGNIFENVRKQGALNLDGNSWAEVHDNASLDFSSGMTLEAWIYIEDNATQGRILNKWGASGADRSYQVFMNNAVVRFLIGDGTSQNGLNSATSLSVGNWYHIVGTYDSTNIKIYIDGSEDVSVAETFTLVDSAETLYLGTYYNQTNTSVNPLAQPRIYNRALTAEEVERNYNAGKNIYK